MGKFLMGLVICLVAALVFNVGNVAKAALTADQSVEITLDNFNTIRVTGGAITIVFDENDFTDGGTLKPTASKDDTSAKLYYIAMSCTKITAKLDSPYSTGITLEAEVTGVRKTLITTAVEMVSFTPFAAGWGEQITYWATIDLDTLGPTSTVDETKTVTWTIT